MAKRKPARASVRPRKGSQKAAKATARPARSGAAAARGRKRSMPKRGTARVAARKAPKAKIARKAPAAKVAAKAAPTRNNTRNAAKAILTAPRKTAGPKAGKSPRLDRARRILNDTVPSPPSSLDLDRRGSAVRTGRAEMAQSRENLGDMGALTRGDVDADAENAYFSGDEAPGGDNPTPDQDIVDDIGRAIGVEYQDNEELRSSDKVVERDKHRWELDPASAEDYKDRK